MMVLGVTFGELRGWVASAGTVSPAALKAAAITIGVKLLTFGSVLTRL